MGERERNAPPLPLLAPERRNKQTAHLILNHPQTLKEEPSRSALARKESLGRKVSEGKSRKESLGRKVSEGKSREDMACPMRIILMLFSALVALFLGLRMASSPHAQHQQQHQRQQREEKKKDRDHSRRHWAKEALAFGWESFSGIYLWRLWQESQQKNAA